MIPVCRRFVVLQTATPNFTNLTYNFGTMMAKYWRCQYRVVSSPTQ